MRRHEMEGAMSKRSIHGTAVFAVVVLALAFLAGCGGGDGGSPVSGKADVRGYVSSTWGISADPAPHGVLGSIEVTGELEPDTTVDRASVTVTKKTRIILEAGGGRSQGGFDDLSVGQRVEVVFTGPVMESYPVQATAGEITVLEASGIGEVKDRHELTIMSIPGVVGYGISSRDGRPVIVVMLENDSPALRSQIPAELEGFEVVTEVTGPIEALPE